MTQFEAALFDYGGVFSASPFHAVSDIGREMGADPQVLLDTIFGPYDSDTDHPWHRLERGEVSLPVAVEEIVELGKTRGVESNPLTFLAKMGASGAGLYQVVIDCTRSLKEKGIKTALVTNNAAEFREHWRKSLPLDDLFDVVVDSSEEGVRKPDPVIFERTLERLDVQAEKSAFLDDYAGNIVAAEALGIRGILVGADPGEAIAQVNELFGL